MDSGHDYNNQPLDFERSLEMRRVNEGADKNPKAQVFTPLHPPWTWPASPGVVPGGVLMSLCARAAWETLPDLSSMSRSQSTSVQAGKTQDDSNPDWTLSSLNCTFLAGMDAKTHAVDQKTGKSKPIKPIQYHVTVLSTGRRFQVRSVVAVQNGKNIVNATIGFVSLKGGLITKGMRMQHAVTAASPIEPISDRSIPQSKPTTVPSAITNDDLRFGRRSVGPFMEFQRLPLLGSSSDGGHRVLALGEPRHPERSIAPTLARIFTPISKSTGRTRQAQMHVLGLLNLSDYHVLDAPLSLQGVSYGYPLIGDGWDKATPSEVNLFTSLNHTVHFHSPELAGLTWRADEIVYIEVTSQWTRNGRAMVESRIFATEMKDGVRVVGDLIATCAQEAYFVLKDSAKLPHNSKL